MFDIFIKFSDYSLLVKSIIVGWIIYTAVIAIVIILAKPIVKREPEQQKQTTPQDAELELLDKKTVTSKIKSISSAVTVKAPQQPPQPVIYAPGGNVISGSTIHGNVTQNNEFP